MTTEGIEGDHLNNHGHNHSHHGGGDHSHALSVDADRRYLTVAPKQTAVPIPPS